MILRAHMRSRTPATGPSERTAPVLFVGVGAACRVLMSLSLKNGVFSIHTQTATGSDMTDTCLSRDLPDIADDLPFFTDCRRRLHRRPEEGWTEFESTWTVVSALKAMGCEVVTGADLIEPEAVMGRDAAKVEAAQRRALEAGVPEAFLTSLDGWTGAATTIDTGRPGPLTVFRFEIDCVCVSESLEPGRLPVDLGFASERPGLMHSCGHDMHAATGLTLARWVTANRDALCGRIRFVFQPAEEGVRGRIPCDGKDRHQLPRLLRIRHGRDGCRSCDARHAGDSQTFRGREPHLRGHARGRRGEGTDVRRSARRHSGGGGLHVGGREASG